MGPKVERTMAIAVYFPVKNMPAKLYDQVMEELTGAGAGAPKGRLYHSAFGDPSGLRVFDVYDSPESFEAFGAILGAILAKHGIDTGEPMVQPMHNVVLG